MTRLFRNIISKIKGKEPILSAVKEPLSLGNHTYDGFIFTHIPKCGGTSFRKYINRSARSSGVPIKQIYIPGENSLGVRKNISQLTDAEREDFAQEHYRVIAMHSRPRLHIQYARHLKNPFYFTILRKPIRRFISHYYFFNYRQGNNDCKGIHLDDLEEARLENLLSRLGNIQVKFMSNTPMHANLMTKEALDMAKENLSAYPCFGILEKMDLSVTYLKSKGPKWLSFGDYYPVTNTYRGKNKFVQLISDSVMDKIKAHNTWDIQFYDFALNLFKERTTFL